MDKRSRESIILSIEEYSFLNKKVLRVTLKPEDVILPGEIIDFANKKFKVTSAIRIIPSIPDSYFHYDLFVIEYKTNSII
jgi:hypothetical protein